MSWPGLRQFQGSNSCKRDAGWSLIRRSTSASQARGSVLFSLAQSFDLLRRKSHGFTMLTGGAAFYYPMLTEGAESGIIASAHIETRAFAAVQDLLVAGDGTGSLAAWRQLCDLPGLLFAEPTPGPIKHWLWRAGLIDSAEVRLPMIPVSDGLAARIEC